MGAAFFMDELKRVKGCIRRMLNLVCLYIIQEIHTMRKLFFSIVCVFYLAIVNVCGQQPPTMYPSVLVELFSSEGCSSCPQADAFLHELITIADSTQSPVYCLDYHVDIWNRSGWVDRFSDTSFSRRQREYMVKTNQMAMFTPMMFVNGQGALPGSAKKEIGKLINREMGTPPKTSLMTKAGYVAQEKKLIVQYEIEGMTDSCNVHFVLAYRAVESVVTGGENMGKTLVHHQTAKVWKEVAIDPSKKGKVELDLPLDIPLSNLMLISFVQHKRTWNIFATDQLVFR